MKCCPSVGKDEMYSGHKKAGATSPSDVSLPVQRIAACTLIVTSNSFQFQDLICWSSKSLAQLRKWLNAWSPFASLPSADIFRIDSYAFGQILLSQSGCLTCLFEVFFQVQSSSLFFRMSAAISWITPAIMKQIPILVNIPLLARWIVLLFSCRKEFFKLPPVILKIGFETCVVRSDIFQRGSRSNQRWSLSLHLPPAHASW